MVKVRSCIRNKRNHKGACDKIIVFRMCYILFFLCVCRCCFDVFYAAPAAVVVSIYISFFSVKVFNMGYLCSLMMKHTVCLANQWKGPNVKKKQTSIEISAQNQYISNGW